MLKFVVFFVVFKCSQSYEYSENNNIARMMSPQPRGMPMPSIMLSQGGGEPHIPPMYIPESQAYVASEVTAATKPAHEYWEEETTSNSTDNKNCLLCEGKDSGACRAMPSCISCEPIASTLCEHTIPCLRCTVIKNPYFRCTPGEKYMDECDNCRCLDGHSGKCTHTWCEFRTLNSYAMKLSDGEFY